MNEPTIPTHFGITNMRWLGERVVPVVPVDPLRSSATISDLEFVQAIAKLRKPVPVDPELPFQLRYHWVMIWDLAAELEIHPNRVKSKFRRAYKRKLVDGCNCGCRGDFELLPAGEALLKASIVSDFIEIGLALGTFKFYNY